MNNMNNVNNCNNATDNSISQFFPSMTTIKSTSTSIMGNQPQQIESFRAPNTPDEIDLLERDLMQSFNEKIARATELQKKYAAVAMKHKDNNDRSAALKYLQLAKSFKEAVGLLTSGTDVGEYLLFTSRFDFYN